MSDEPRSHHPITGGPIGEDPIAAPRRTIPDPGFAGDDGRVAEEVAAALAAYAADPARGYRPALAALQRSRVLVPVVAVLGEVEYDEHGRARDKTSDMATVLMTGADGRTGLLAFTGTAALERWDPAARPVPVTVPDAARAARHDGAAALLIDLAGPTGFVIEGGDLAALADGLVLGRVEGSGGAGSSWAWLRLPD